VSDVRSYCSFFIDGTYFGVSALDVQELIRQQPMTRVPLADETISGLINLRGQIVTAIDLRRCLGLPARSSTATAMNVVLHTADGALSLLVDRIGDIVEAADEDLYTPPETVHREVRALLRGALPLPDRLLLVLDTARLCAAGASSFSS
jgi:purine-binding chemotaxis protein CheW